MEQRRALLSVSDKTGIAQLGMALVEMGFELVSTGGTAKTLVEAGVPVTPVEEVTRSPEILGGRVKTLHPKIHGGILAIRDDPIHQADLQHREIEPFDLVVVNLYPFSSDPSIEQMDIGGPAMLRAAAKNHAFVGVVTDSADYPLVVDELQRDGEISDETRKQLATKAFAHTAQYDQRIVEWLGGDEYEGELGQLVGLCKYGENPYMVPAALYKTDDNDPLAVHRFEAISGAERSYINVTDVDCLLQVLTHIAAGFQLNFDEEPFMAVAVKHGNACGAAVGDDPVMVIKQMVAGDKRAIFGAVVMTNFPVTREVAEALMERSHDDPMPALLDGVFCPAFDQDAPEVLERKQGKCRMMASPALANLPIDSLDKTPRKRQVRGGFLKQPNYDFVLDLSKSNVHGKELTEQQKRDIVLAWAIGCVSNSNTIVLAREGQLIGLGVGQPDRVGAVELALKRAHDAGHSTRTAKVEYDENKNPRIQYFADRSVLWSDSFFPAPDGPEIAARAGVGAIFTSSGSLRDTNTAYVCGQYRLTLAMQPDAEVRGFAKH